MLDLARSPGRWYEESSDIQTKVLQQTWKQSSRNPEEIEVMNDPYCASQMPSNLNSTSTSSGSSSFLYSSDLLGQQSNCCRSKKSICGRIPLCNYLLVYILCFLHVLDRSYFTSMTPKTNRQIYSSVVTRFRFITRRRPRAPWWPFNRTRSAREKNTPCEKVVQKSASSTILQSLDSSTIYVQTNLFSCFLLAPQQTHAPVVACCILYTW